MDCKVLAGAIASSILATGLAVAQPTERQVTFRPGAISAELRGVIRGDADVTYRLTTVPG
ncbi:MAG: hypothetical protein Q8O26_19525 [Phreatobacter sp.]|uniref:hypothetical protein n=1 Tax=Phreatobacter sp. TaxID=1966341 RepID=UPI00273245CE|nr:hypothetical protein [Phreatobacter sp.]MDP2804067.1 hypothetical protein [Phreatobacter sp.]